MTWEMLVPLGEDDGFIRRCLHPRNPFNGISMACTQFLCQPLDYLVHGFVAEVRDLILDGDKLNYTSPIYQVCAQWWCTCTFSLIPSPAHSRSPVKLFAWRVSILLTTTIK